jgi:cytochrome c oxidase cbb3-type subunit 3
MCSAFLRVRAATAAVRCPPYGMAALVLLIAATLAACEREQRPLRSDPGTVEELGAIPVSKLAPGGDTPSLPNTGEDYEANAYHLSEGKRLYTWFNCNGCHANGGGGSGPALMDDKWIYGGEIQNIFATIRDGRPNGMPSFGQVIPAEQIWQLAGYIRSMGGHVSQAAAPGRNDSLQARPAENRLPSAQPGSALPTGANPQ